MDVLHLSDPLDHVLLQNFGVRVISLVQVLDGLQLGNRRGDANLHLDGGLQQKKTRDVLLVNAKTNGKYISRPGRDNCIPTWG